MSLRALEDLRGFIAERDLPALLLTDLLNIRRSTGFSGSAARVIVTPDTARFLTDSRYAEQAAAQVTDSEVFWFASPVTQDEFLARHVEELGIIRVGFEAENVTVHALEAWRRRMPAVEWVPLGPEVSALRKIKSAEEQARIRAAAGLADAAWAHVTRLFQPGVMESEIELELEFFLRRQGSRLSFEPIVASGPRSALPHGRATDRRLQLGDLLTLDFGAVVEGYASDITRTVAVGQAGPREAEIFDRVMAAQAAALAAMRPGVRAADLDRLARDVLGDFAPAFGHGLGHGLGLAVHDPGRLSASSDDVLAVGQVWTVEPGVYFPGYGGCRIEDNVIITEDGIENLTTAPKQLVVGA
jgi:Xaa-Pro aminopeptidase